MKGHPSYYLGEIVIWKKILDDNLRLHREAIFSNVCDVNTPLGYDDSGYDERQKLHHEAEAAFQSYGETYSQLEKNPSDFNKSYSEADKQVLREREEVNQMSYSDTPISASAKAKVERANARANFKHLPQGSGLKRKQKGSGLKGAGLAPLEGVVRRGRTYNLNEIQGLATPSAYTYKQLCSKYIRIPDLDAKTLVVVQPNRRKCGPKCKISEFKQIILVFYNTKQSTLLNASFDLQLSASVKNAKYFPSPFDTASWTLQPCSSIRNFNVRIGSTQTFDIGHDYDFHHFTNEVAKIGAINVDPTPELVNGLLDYQTWSLTHRMLIADVSILTERDVPQSIQIQGTNAGCQGVNMPILVISEQELTFDRRTGQVLDFTRA
ncbi:unnamed protein product [Phytophthora fragariaefolia]|uniref:Unnamed protein product n=1 Tax=Phytophthora fragariaefolia TaxID=1490495 RepID=A0A9W6Y186_9STRA|nr:unnamed protein product [Phytophthora fragariaefolia]